MTVLDAWGEQLQRELAAPIICFPHGHEEKQTPTQVAMIWYGQRRQARGSAKGIDLNSIQIPINLERSERASATYAALIGCMVGVHPADNLVSRWGTLQAVAKAYFQSNKPDAWERFIEFMLTYYLGSAERGKQSMADRLHISPYKLDMWAGRGESVMQRRFWARGLVP